MSVQADQSEHYAFLEANAADYLSKRPKPTLDILYRGNPS
jgi:hypothetical protein